MPTVSASSVCGFMSRMSSIFFMKWNEMHTFSTWHAEAVVYVKKRFRHWHA
jgi:hypothetical protein